MRVRRRVDRLRDSALHEVAVKLEEFLLSPDSPRDAPDQVERVLDELPRTPFGERFRFDSGLIQGILETWSVGGLHFPGMVVPRYDRSWGHKRLMIPGSGKQRHVIEVIRMPGADDIDEIRLDRYPWVLHELSHLALSMQHFDEEGTLVASFEGKLAADDDARDYWQPGPMQDNWAHEIAADVIATRCAGPAYIRAFEFEALPSRAELIGPSYPRCDVRAAALRMACEKLGWGELAEKPWEAVARAWFGVNWKQTWDDYPAVFNKQLIEIAVDAALQICQLRRLPMYAQEEAARIQALVDQCGPFDCNTDLLLGAYMAHKSLERAAYEEWQAKVISGTLAGISM